MEEVSNRLVDVSLNDVLDSLEGLKEIQLAQLTLLMRIYDMQMGVLTNIDESLADEIFEAHENGRTANPAIWMAPDSSGAGAERPEVPEEDE